MPVMMWLDPVTGRYLPVDMPAGLDYVTQDQLVAATTPRYSGGKQDTDVALTADAYYKVNFETQYQQFPGTNPAASLDIASGTWTVLQSGLYHYELSFDVQHGTNGTGALFSVRLNRAEGNIGASLDATQQVTGWGQRISWTSVEYLAAGQTYFMEIRPVGTGETGWTMTYARHVLWSA